MGCWIAHTIWHNSCHPCSLDTLQLFADLCTTADGLPDGSGSPRRFGRDYKRTAGTVAEHAPLLTAPINLYAYLCVMPPLQGFGLVGFLYPWALPMAEVGRPCRAGKAKGPPTTDHRLRSSGLSDFRSFRLPTPDYYLPTLPEPLFLPATRRNCECPILYNCYQTTLPTR